jgi:hypothetical protein
MNRVVGLRLIITTSRRSTSRSPTVLLIPLTPACLVIPLTPACLVIPLTPACLVIPLTPACLVIHHDGAQTIKETKTPSYADS